MQEPSDLRRIVGRRQSDTKVQAHGQL
jgi:hypothetical protein